MKIAIIGSKRFDGLEYHLQDELTVQGHNAKIFDYENIFPNKIDFGISSLSPNYVFYKNKSLLEKVLNFKPDLVIGTYRDIHPFVVKEIKQNKVKIIHINPDALTTFKNQQLFAEPYDLYFTKDKYIVNFMKKKLALNAHLYHEAFNPRVHFSKNGNFRLEEEKTNIDVLCFGNLYPYRNRMLQLLKISDINLELYGRKAKYFNPYLNKEFKNKGIYGKEKSKRLNGSKIVFNNFHYAEIESVNNKFFEINGIGAFQICDYKPILHDLLPIDPKRISFESIDEAVNLIDYYLHNEEERWDIRRTMKQHFIENHTYKKLIDFVFSKL